MKTVRSRIAAALAAVLCVMLAMAIVLSWGMARLEDFQRLTSHAYRELDAYAALFGSANRYAKELGDLHHSINEDAMELTRARYEFEAALDELKRVLATDEYDENKDDEVAISKKHKEQQRATALRTLFTEVEEALREVPPHEHTLAQDPADAWIDAIIEEKLERELIVVSRSALEEENQEVLILERQTRTITRSLAMTTLGMMGLAVLLSAIIGKVMTRMIMRPVEELSKGAEAFGRGDLSYRVEESGTDELGALEKQFNAMAERLKEQGSALQQAYQLQSDFLAIVSHELRSPLNSIIGFAQLISEKDGGLADRSRQNLGRIEGSARKLLRLVNDILDFSRLKAGRMEVREAPFSVRELLDQVVEEAQALAHGTPTSVGLEAGGDLGEMVSDELQVRQILGNLLSNAVKFTDQGVVTLRAERAGREVRFQVVDTGMGIHEEQLQMIFEPFRQTEGKDSRWRGGTGLGLAIVARLVALLKGEVRVESKIEEGSTFTVVLPDRGGDVDGG